MKIDSILNVLEKHCEKDTIQDINNGRRGLSAQEIANSLHMLRNNVSAELQKLFKMGKVIKVKQKTIYYYPTSQLMKLSKQKFRYPCEVQDLKLLLADEINQSNYIDAFDEMIGCRDSLQPMINSAKAALLYPGTPLNILLLGKSGTGKSYFAQKIFEFGKANNVFSKDSKFVVFNCADFTDNSSLLLANLFGHVKGAYTGADEDRIGLIERANGGVLFLDEIHRLPPEGQEMLFHFIDHKRFHRLGESGVERSANVFLIMATTKDPKSHLLTTFVRRIPMSIQMPSLEEKTMYERFNLISNLILQEANAIQNDIIIERAALVPLILYTPPGNIGQLKNDIKLAVARSHLNSKSNCGPLCISKDALSYPVISSLETIDIQKRKQIEHLLHKDSYLIEENKGNCAESSKRKSNIRIPFAKNVFTYDQYVEQFALNYTDFSKKIAVFDQEIIEIISFVHEWLFQNFDILIDETQNMSLAFFFRNLKEGLLEKGKVIKEEYSLKTYDLTHQLVKILEQKYFFNFSKEEVTDLANMLEKISQNKNVIPTVEILVCSHGDSLATNIATVVNELLSCKCVTAFDMPLTENVTTIANRMITYINELSRDKEVLLFVDMGSLMSIDKILKQKTKVDVTIIPTNNLLLVLETARKAVALNKDKYSLLSDLINMHSQIANDFQLKIKKKLSLNTKRIIYTICHTGEGTAHYLERYIYSFLQDNHIYNVEIIALTNSDVIKLRSIIKDTSKEKEVIAIVGNVNPSLNEYPYISIEEVLLHNGLEKLVTLLGEDIQISKQTLDSLNRNIVISIAADEVDKYLSFLSSNKIKGAIINLIQKYEQSQNIVLSNRAVIKLIIHISCMIERLLLNNNQTVGDISIVKSKEMPEALKSGLLELEQIFGIMFNEEELELMFEIFEEEIEMI